MSGVMSYDTYYPFQILSRHQLSMLDFEPVDEEPVDVKRWTRLGNVRVYYNFFKKHEDEFY